MKHTHTPLREEQAGLGHVLAVVLIVVVLAVVGLVGWKVAGKNKPKASTTTTTMTNSTEATAATAGCVATYHDANLCKFSTHSDITKMPYKATLNVVNSNGTGTMTLSSDGKGNTESDMTTNGTTINTVQLDSATYMQSTPGGTWYEYPSGTSAPSDSSSSATSAMSLALGSTVKYKPLGTAACGSMTCYEYSVTDSLMPDTTQYVWFDTSQYLLREWKDTDNTGDSTDMMISYPASVSISKPSPVQPYTSMMQ